jgi:hypothetical protein
MFLPLSVFQTKLKEKKLAYLSGEGYLEWEKTCGLYYKCFTIVIYDRNDSVQYYKTMIVVKTSLS